MGFSFLTGLVSFRDRHDLSGRDKAKTSGLPALLVGAALCISSCAHSGEFDSGGAVEAGEPISVVDKLTAAEELIRSGQARYDAMLIALGAEQMAEALGQWTIRGNADGGIRSPEEWLETARIVAKEDGLALGVIDRIEGRRTRGRKGGPKVQIVLASKSQPVLLEEAFDPGTGIVYVESVVGVGALLDVHGAGDAAECDRKQARRKQVCQWTVRRDRDYKITVATSVATLTEVLVITN
tara:strand:+ start:7584 stop:8300 length:717 start_codon:yes stop_codon:yes gene_type:complete